MKKWMVLIIICILLCTAYVISESKEVNGEPDVISSMSFNRDQNLVVIANRSIEDKQIFAEELIQMCVDNSFKTIKFSTDYGYATGIKMDVYLTKEDFENGKKPVLRVEYTQESVQREYDIVNNPEMFTLTVK